MAPRRRFTRRAPRDEIVGTPESPSEGRRGPGLLDFLWQLVRWVLGAIVYAGLTIPLILLVGIRPWILAVGLSVVSALYIAFMVRVRRQRLGKALRSSAYVLGAAVLLALLSSTGTLDPLLCKEGLLAPTVELVIEPMLARPGELLSFHVTATSRGPAPLGTSQFWIDGAPHRGVMVYALVPFFDGSRLAIAQTPSGAIWFGGGPEGAQTVQVVFADPFNFTSSPLYWEGREDHWEWRSEYATGDKVVACVTTGPVARGLAVGESIEFSFAVLIPEGSNPGKLSQIGAILAYSAPYSLRSQEFFVWEAPSSPPAVVAD